MQGEEKEGGIIERLGALEKLPFPVEQGDSTPEGVYQRIETLESLMGL